MITSNQEILASDVALHYNELDLLYRKVWGEDLHHCLWKKGVTTKKEATQELTREVARTMSLKPNQRVCDIGCGYGAPAQLLADEFAAQVTGITLSQSQIQNIPAPRINHEKLHFRCLDWLKNDFGPSSFDHLMSIESSEHMPDKNRFFEEAYRVVKPGGSLVICAWLASNSPSPREVRYLLEPICREGRLPSMGSELDYREMFCAAGFKSVSFQDITDEMKKTWSLALWHLFGYFTQHPTDLKLLSKRFNTNSDFLKSLFRIRYAYETRAMRYGIFKGIKE